MVCPDGDASISHKESLISPKASPKISQVKKVQQEDDFKTLDPNEISVNLLTDAKIDPLIMKSSEKNQVVYQDYPISWKDNANSDCLEIEDVRDWPERIKHYDAKTKQLYERCFKKHKEFVDVVY